MADEKKYKVLTVDDDECLLNMYSVKFSKSGIDVHTANTAENALRLLHEGLAPDALILDIVMPTMDGFQLLEKIKEEKLSRNTVVLRLTNHGQSSDAERAKSLGAKGYIVKASTIPSEVLTEVARSLEGKK